MLKLYVKGADLLDRLRSNKDGVVSFEYVIVAAGIVTVVAAVFSTTGTNPIGAALNTGIGKIVAAMP
jgi:hypothetical protein